MEEYIRTIEDFIRAMEGFTWKIERRMVPDKLFLFLICDMLGFYQIKRRSEMVFVEAKVIDSTHLELSKPIETPHGRRVIVSVAEPTGEGEERGDWFYLAAKGLQSAYGDSEPEYETSIVKEPNPEFHP